MCPGAVQAGGDQADVGRVELLCLCLHRAVLKLQRPPLGICKTLHGCQEGQSLTRELGTDRIRWAAGDLP